MTDIERYNINEYQSDDFYICLCDTDNINVECDMSLFSGYRRKRLSGLKRTASRQASIGAEMMLIHALRQCMPQTVLPVQYATGEYGKPYFTELRGWYFSLSHSGTKAACMLSRRPCGVDIQEIRSADMRLAERYYTADERAQCGKDVFFRIWSRKEAVAKADGRGLGAGLGSFDVCGDMAVCGGAAYHIYDIKAPSGYVLAAAMKDL